MKIPFEAKKIFSGEIFSVYQWPQKMYDGSIATFEMVKRPDTVLIIPTVDDKIVLAEEQQPRKNKKITLLGGRRNAGEKTIAAAKRELREESGLVSDDWELLYEFQPVSKMEWTIFCFIARDCQQAFSQKLDGGEKISLKKVSFAHFVKLVTRRESGDQELANEILRLELSGQLKKFHQKIFKN